MQITYLNYVLASITAYLGLLLGIILIRLAAEEQKQGKKYFILLKKILFLLILAALLFFYKVKAILSIVLLLLAIVLMLNKKINLEKSAFVYLILGIVLYLSSKIPNLFITESALIFLYGIPNASLMLDLKEKNYYDILVKNLLFFIPVILLYFIL